MHEDWSTVSVLDDPHMRLQLIHQSSVTSKTSSGHTILLPIMILNGTKRGIHGRSLTLTSWASWRHSRRRRQISLAMSWLYILYRLSMVSYMTVCFAGPYSVINQTVGFFRSIALRNVNALQDTLRLLTMWFKYGAHDEVSHAMAAGFTNVEVDTWLEVIPQVWSLYPRATSSLTICPHRSSRAFKLPAQISGGISTIYLRTSANIIHRP